MGRVTRQQLDPSETIDGSYGSAERDLFAAIIRMSITDLTIGDPIARRDAVDFWTTEEPEYVAHRKELLHVVGLDHDATCAKVRELIKPEPEPQRPTTRQEWRDQDMLISKRRPLGEIRADKVEAFLPQDDQRFSADDLQIDGLSRPQISKALRVLQRRGVVNVYERGCRHQKMTYTVRKYLTPLRNAASH